MVSVWISQENALVQNLVPNGTFFAWEMIKKTHHQHKSIKFNFDFTKSFEYSDEWPTNPGISDTPEMHRDVHWAHLAACGHLGPWYLPSWRVPVQLECPCIAGLTLYS